MHPHRQLVRHGQQVGWVQRQEAFGGAAFPMHGHAQLVGQRHHGAVIGLTQRIEFLGAAVARPKAGAAKQLGTDPIAALVGIDRHPGLGDVLGKGDVHAAHQTVVHETAEDQVVGTDIGHVAVDHLVGDVGMGEAELPVIGRQPLQMVREQQALVDVQLADQHHKPSVPAMVYGMAANLCTATQFCAFAKYSRPGGQPRPMLPQTIQPLSVSPTRPGQPALSRGFPAVPPDRRVGGAVRGSPARPPTKRAPRGALQCLLLERPYSKRPRARASTR